MTPLCTMIVRALIPMRSKPAVVFILAELDRCWTPAAECGQQPQAEFGDLPLVEDFLQDALPGVQWPLVNLVLCVPPDTSTVGPDIRR